MNDFKLNYLKDTDGRYIVKQISKDESEYSGIIKNNGEYSNNLIVSTEYFEKKFQHQIEDIVRAIEEMTLTQQEIIKEDIIYERFLLEAIPEEEFNPLFARMSEEDIAEYTKNSIKVRVRLIYEFHIKPKSHLILGGLINSFFDLKK